MTATARRRLLPPPHQTSLLDELPVERPQDAWVASCVLQSAEPPVSRPGDACGTCGTWLVGPAGLSETRQVWYVNRRDGPGFCQLWDEVEARAVAACLNGLERRRST